MTNIHLLIVDDERDMRTGLQRMIARRFPDITATLCADAGEALAQIQQQSFDLALLDIRMPGMDGVELLKELRGSDPWMTIIMMTGHGTIETAVEAIRAGAYDFITKPFDKEVLIHTVVNGLERNRLIRENYLLRQKVGNDGTELDIGFVGDSPPMRDFFYNLEIVAKTNYTTLVRGQSGTGKELTARALHKLSPRRDKPFVMVNCPAIPENLLESELFGHVKGAFTDATQNKRGLFNEADGGTLCLDEVGDLPLSVQSKLLRVLQEHEVRPLGATQTRNVDVRVIAITNLDLEDMIEKKLFREDLFYRLNVVTLKTPSLADIYEDIPLLTYHFSNQVCKELGILPKTFCQRAISALVNREWPGNVRELQNVVRRMVMFSRGDIIQFDDLNFAEHPPRSIRGGGGSAPLAGSLAAMTYKAAKQQVVDGFTSQYIAAVLKKTEGNVTQSAEVTGLTRAALQKIMKRLAIVAADYRKI